MSVGTLVFFFGQYKPEGQWNTTANVMVANVKDSRHPVFRASSPLDWGFLKKKSGRCTIHFSAEPSNAELLFHTIHSANQLSINGAVADWCDELTQQIPGQSFLSTEKPVAKVNEQLRRKLPLVGTPETNVQAARHRRRVHQDFL